MPALPLLLLVTWCLASLSVLPASVRQAALVNDTTDTALIPNATGPYRTAIGRARSIERRLASLWPSPPTDPSQRVPVNDRVPQVVGTVDRTRLLYPCIAGGKHNNEFVSLGKAWTLAYHTRRTLVLPSFFQELSTALPGIPFDAMYNLTGGPVPTIPEAAVFARGGHRDAFCIGEFHGYCDAPWFRRAVRCVGSHKRWLRHDPQESVRFLKTLGSKPLLAIGKLYFTKVGTPCMWRHIRPVDVISRVVEQYAKVLPPGYTAVHLRNTYDPVRTPPKKCEQEMQKFKHNLQLYATTHHFKPIDWATILPGCLPTPEYVRKFVADRDTPFYLAWDGHAVMRPYHRRLLAAGAVGYQGPFAPSSLAAMMVDFWLCVAAGSFVGNFYSSMSMNICSIRRAHGRRCANMPDLAPAFPCFPLQDLIYSHGQRVRRSLRT